jgi:hypothetical protein
VFNGDNNAVIYYLPGTTGWVSTFDGRPTALWNPQAQTSGTQLWRVDKPVWFQHHRHQQSGHRGGSLHESG